MCDNDFDGNLQSFMYGRYYKPRFLLDSANVRLVDTPAPRAERRRPTRTWLFDHSAFQAALVGWADQPRWRRPELKWDFGDDTHWNVPAHDLAARVMHLHLRQLAREGKVRLAG